MDVADEDGAAFGEGGFALGVAFEEAVEVLAVVDAVDANVDQGGAGLDHIGRYEAGAADGGDQDVGLAGDLAEVAGLGVADGDGGVVVQQKHGGGLAYDVAAADYHSVLAGDGDVAALEDLDDTRRRARREGGATGLEAAGVDGMEAVNIFLGRDGVEEGLGVNLLGQRKLDEDAVDVVAGVELGDEGEHLGGGDGVGRGDEVAEDAQFLAGFDFAADVNLRGGHVADEDGGEAGTDAAGGELLYVFRDFLLDLGGDGCAIEDFRHDCSTEHGKGAELAGRQVGQSASRRVSGAYGGFLGLVVRQSRLYPFRRKCGNDGHGKSAAKEKMPSRVWVRTNCRVIAESCGVLF